MRQASLPGDASQLQCKHFQHLQILASGAMCGLIVPAMHDSANALSSSEFHQLWSAMHDSSLYFTDWQQHPGLTASCSKLLFLYISCSLALPHAMLS